MLLIIICKNVKVLVVTNSHSGIILLTYFSNEAEITSMLKNLHLVGGGGGGTKGRWWGFFF